MSNNNINDIEFQKDWCITILQFMTDQYPDDVRGKYYKEFFQGKIHTILKFTEQNNKRGMKAGMKMVYNDTNELARYEALNLGELNKLLKRNSADH